MIAKRSDEYNQGETNYSCIRTIPAVEEVAEAIFYFFSKTSKILLFYCRPVRKLWSAKIISLLVSLNIVTAKRAIK